MPLDLADDGGRGEGGQLNAAGGIESINRIDQPYSAHLDEIIQRLAPISETASQIFH